MAIDSVLAAVTPRDSRACGDGKRIACRVQYLVKLTGKLDIFSLIGVEIIPEFGNLL